MAPAQPSAEAQLEAQQHEEAAQPAPGTAGRPGCAPRAGLWAGGGSQPPPPREGAGGLARLLRPCPAHAPKVQQPPSPGAAAVAGRGTWGEEVPGQAARSPGSQEE
eukprot:13590917-Alexandrium_andersonii.AAC.1